MGKGDSPRPFSVDLKTFDNNWDTIFGKKKNSDPPVQTQVDQAETKDSDQTSEN